MCGMRDFSLAGPWGGLKPPPIEPETAIVAATGVHLLVGQDRLGALTSELATASPDNPCRVRNDPPGGPQPPDTNAPRGGDHAHIRSPSHAMPPARHKAASLPKHFRELPRAEPKRLCPAC